jgi:F-type H+-transporting ATPase subunit c
VAIGMGLMVIGAAKGIGNIGGNAVQAIARQPEAGDRIFTSMLLSAALIEGFTFFALLVQFTL